MSERKFENAVGVGWEEVLEGLVRIHTYTEALARQRIILPIDELDEIAVLGFGAGQEPWYFNKRGVKRVVGVDNQSEAQPPFNRAIPDFLEGVEMVNEHFVDWLYKQTSESWKLMVCLRPGYRTLFYKKPLFSRVLKTSFFDEFEGKYNLVITREIARVLASGGALVMCGEGTPDESEIGEELILEKIKVDYNLPPLEFMSEVPWRGKSYEQVRDEMPTKYFPSVLKKAA